MNRNRWNICGVAALAACCFGNTLFADSFYPGYVTCQTESRGLQFSMSERDSNLARSLTLSACTGDSRTNNDECHANVWCNDQSAYPPPMIPCQTTSNGLTFERASRDPGLSRSLAVSACTSDSRTNNDECRANLICNDGSYIPAVVSCTTDSNGLTFSHQDRDPNLARQLAASACTGDSRTNNDECHANMWCSNQGFAPPRFDCSTQSHGLVFRHDGRDLALTQSRAISACTGDSRTNNDECRANLYCGQGR